MALEHIVVRGRTYLLLLHIQNDSKGDADLSITQEIQYRLVCSLYLINSVIYIMQKFRANKLDIYSPIKHRTNDGTLYYERFLTL